MTTYPLLDEPETQAPPADTDSTRPTGLTATTGNRVGFVVLLAGTAVMYLWNITINGMGNQSGAGNSIAGVKWRFFDAGDDGWKMSVYPQVQSRFPVSGSPS